MTNVGQSDKDAQSFMAHYFEIHDTQARSARSELVRLRGLIDDASERLMASFDVIGEISARHAQADQSPHGLSQDIELAVGSAVSALQFHDMANQLVGHAVQRIEILERITASLSRLPEVSVDDLTRAVEGTAAARTDGPVEQACMAGGSVELF